jgi:hypothetical protein
LYVQLSIGDNLSWLGLKIAGTEYEFDMDGTNIPEITYVVSALSPEGQIDFQYAYVDTYGFYADWSPLQVLANSNFFIGELRN